MIDWIEKNPRDPRYDYDWGRRFEIAENGKVNWTTASKMWPNPKNPQYSWAWRRIDAGRRALQYPELLCHFINSPHMTAGLLVSILNSVHEHGEFLANNPTRDFTRDNHGLYEAEGTACLGVIFKEFYQAEHWRKRAFELLEKEIVKQVRPDGFQVENVLSYQMASLRMFSDSMLIALRNGFPEFPKWYQARIRQMIQAIEAVSYPDGTVARFGDQAKVTNVDNSINSWYRHFGLERRSDKTHVGSTALRWSGLYTMRSNWTRSATMAIVRCGPSYNAHSHKDAGTFTVFAGGRVLLPDSGCYTYNGIKDAVPTDNDRIYFQGSVAHNVLTLEDEDAHIVSLNNGPYRDLKGYDDCGVIRWQPSHDFGHKTLVIENHNTYQNPAAMSHRRALIATTDNDTFVVVDEALGAAGGNVRVRFHLFPTRTDLGSDRISMWSQAEDGPNLLIQGIRVHPDLTLTPEKTRLSMAMGKSEKRPAAMFAVNKMPHETVQFITVLKVFYGHTAPTVTMAVKSKPGDTRVSLQLEMNGKTFPIQYSFDPRRTQMSPPPAEFELKTQPEYIPFYNNFMPVAEVGDPFVPERTCTRLRPHREGQPALATCEPHTFITKIEMNKRYSPVIVENGRYIYCGIPKCGVSRWRRLARRVEGNPNWYDNKAHSPTGNGLKYLADFTEQGADSYINNASIYSFIIVRSPYSRLLSGWLDKKDFPSFNYVPNDFGKFIEWLENQPDANKLNEHFRPMTSFCGILDGMKFDFVAKMEEVDSWGPTLVKKLGINKFVNSGWGGGFFRSSGDNIAHNHHTEKRLLEFYTPERMRVVEQVYASDFATFGYPIGHL
jgi:heparan-sulfate lyase